MTSDIVLESFRHQSKACAALGSPFMARLMALCADRLKPGHPVADAVLGWQGDPRTQADNVPLRLAGALHALCIQNLALAETYPPHAATDEAVWAAVIGAMNDHTSHILDWLTNAPQTNEVRRAAAILLALALLKTRFSCDFDLLELGASAGLNLQAHRFQLSLPGAQLGDTNAAVILAPEWSGPLPPTDLPRIAGQSGVDLNPLDPTQPDDQLRLLAYLWPDQPDRLARTKAAIKLATEHPVKIDKGDAGDWLTQRLKTPPNGVGRLVFHTVAAQYFPPATSNTVAQALATAGAQATKDEPLAHLSMEADGGHGAAVHLTMWPNGARQRIARADFHGRWVEWTPDTPALGLS